ncbi:(Fe-S)-binding protein [Thermodesulfobacteriota bacterium]
MKINDYRLEIFNNDCMPGAMSVQCHAHLPRDVGPALPYLNAELGGFEYIKDPPSVTFKVQGKLITVHGQTIAVNALKNEEEAHKIVEWILREIDEVWENRHNIEPKYEGLPKPNLMEILKHLPKTNCKACGAPTCLVFATQMADGAKGGEDCPPLNSDKIKALTAYMAGFNLDGLN